MSEQQSRPGGGTRAANVSRPGDTQSLTAVYLSDQHRAAAGYARRGWKVLPLLPPNSPRPQPGKAPITASGLHDATLDLETVDRWWWRWPSANVGIAIPHQYIVLDLDPRNGGSLETLAQLGRLPATLTSESGRRDGGRHFYLGRPNGPLTGTRLPDGWDLKVGGRGYVVAPPSIHPATGLPYRWTRRAPIAPAPAWLATLLRPAPQPARPVPRHQPGTGDRGAGLIRHVAGLQPGNRNAGFYWSACRAAEDGILDQLTEQLVSAAVGIGLPESEARRTITSARRTAVH